MKAELEAFAAQQRFIGKGPLCVALVLTDAVKNKAFPLNEEDYIADSGGQVAGLGRAAVQSILARHGIDRILAEEGGRTSRGSIAKMRAYVRFLNQIHKHGILDLIEAEEFWIERVRAFFSAKPLKLRVDNRLGLRIVLRHLIGQAQERQDSSDGTMIVGTVMQHLVGAKLDVVLKGSTVVSHHGSNQSDQQKDRTGDFDIGDVSIHVTNAPSESLLRKCSANIESGRKPIIITSRKGTAVADGLAEYLGISECIDVIEFEQFMATNIYELGNFLSDKRRATIEEIIDRYNAIVAECETDPSLSIEIATGKT